MINSRDNNNTQKKSGKVIMNPSEMLYRKLKEAGLDFFVSVPCRLLDGLIRLIKEDETIIYTPVTREEEGIGVLSGAALAGKRRAILMQNSGLGNSINAICSLSNFYGLPLVFIISHRGTEGEMIDAQRPMGNVTKNLLESADVPYHEIKSTKDLGKLNKSIGKSFSENRSIAFLFPHSFWRESGEVE
jgi:sulfopyruvate decarboxylase subunit alpha